MKIRFIVSITIAMSMLLLNVAYAVSNAPAPAQNFFSDSWTKTEKSDKYWTECRVTISKPIRAQGLSADDNKVLDMYEKAFKIYKETITQIFIGQDTKAKQYAEKFNSMRILDDDYSGSMTSDERMKALDDIGKNILQFIIAGADFYYNAGYKNNQIGWKIVTDAKTAGEIWDPISKSKLTDDFDKNSFLFSKWRKAGKVKQAVYKGKMTAEAVKQSIDDSVGAIENFVSPSNETMLYIDEKTGDFVKSESSAKVTWPKGSFSLKQTCYYDFAKKVKIGLPQNAGIEAPEVGFSKFAEMMNNW